MTQKHAMGILHRNMRIVQKYAMKIQPRNMQWECCTEVCNENVVLKHATGIHAFEIQKRKKNLLEKIDKEVFCN